MEIQLSEIPLLKKSKDGKLSSKSESSCCSQPANGAACCTHDRKVEESEGICCVQPENGSACCDQ